MEALLADTILVVHLLFIAFVLGGQGCILAGAWRGWAWVRRPGFRILHLAAIAIITLQAWVGMVCPLTILENAFRRAAGEGAYGGTFVGHWLSRLVYFDAPQWVFTTAYTLFALLVLATWFLVKPGKGKGVASS